MTTKSLGNAHCSLPVLISSLVTLISTQTTLESEVRKACYIRLFTVKLISLLGSCIYLHIKLFPWYFRFRKRIESPSLDLQDTMNNMTAT